MKIVCDGIAVCGIVMPENPTLRERFAANELIDYVRKISGAELEITDKYENKIIIGSPERNPEAGKIISNEAFNKKVDGKEGFMLFADEKSFLIAGSNFEDCERGTVYAVYELLERFFGCALSAYTKKGVDAGEIVPQNKTLEFFGEYVKNHADLEYRTAISQYDVWVGDPDHELNGEFFSWLAKNRFNRVLTWSGVYEGLKKDMLKEAEKRGISFSVGHHQAFSVFLPPEGNEYFDKKYCETNPEFFKLQEDGTRYKFKNGDYMGQLILCMRNRELIEEFAKNVVKWARLNPQADVICLWPQDGCHPQCCCDECSKHTKTANYSYFVGEVAKIVNTSLPNLKFDRIAYVDLLDCDEAELSKNVIIDEAVWFSSGLRKIGKPDGSGITGTVYEDTLRAWSNTGATTVYYDYYMGVYSCKQKWMPAADEIQANAKRMRELGIWGAGSQLELFNMWNHLFNFYSLGRVQYDNSISFDEALESFTKLFGNGAEQIREIIRMGEALLDGQISIIEASNFVIDNIDRPKVYELYEKALANGESKRVRNNIRLMRMVFRYSDLEAHSEKYNNDEMKTVVYKSSELKYMRENFDSYCKNSTQARSGYGISIPVCAEENESFVPDKWYMLE